MANKKKGFLLYFDSYPCLAQLTDAECGKLLRALFQYAESVRESDADPIETLKQLPPMEPETQMAFCFMAGNIRRDTAVWLKRQQTLSAAAKARSEQQRSPSRPGGTEHPNTELRQYVQALHQDTPKQTEEQASRDAWA